MDKVVSKNSASIQELGVKCKQSGVTSEHISKDVSSCFFKGYLAKTTLQGSKSRTIPQEKIVKKESILGSTTLLIPKSLLKKDFKGFKKFKRILKLPLRYKKSKPKSILSFSLSNERPVKLISRLSSLNRSKRIIKNQTPPLSSSSGKESLCNTLTRSTSKSIKTRGKFSSLSDFHIQRPKKKLLNGLSNKVRSLADADYIKKLMVKPPIYPVQK
ncbi:unnamed protein product [Moneuplotes crassus]|uniref:Uncharacterized protein n=1 Tax=Euplotes crassus TaxID=5936 RepID=A0AAD1UFE0_EUPCR|nr:unnamed protein product [Moneuplotes crassus]